MWVIVNVILALSGPTPILVALVVYVNTLLLILPVIPFEPLAVIDVNAFVVPSNAVIVIGSGISEPVPNEVASIVCAPGEAFTTITGGADFTLVTEQTTVFVF